MSPRIRFISTLALFAVPLIGTGCIPYTVGSTAQTVAPGYNEQTTSYYFIPNGIRFPDDSVSAPLSGVDFEWRHGLDERSDVGVRALAGGVVLNYKRKISDDVTPGAPALAYMLGTGVVNGGEHLHLEATLIASGDERQSLSAFGGLRAMQVIPISSDAVSDRPTLGVFGGFQVGDASFAVRPELGVYYDHSALGIRRGDLVLVPAITLRRGPRTESMRRDLPGREATRPDLPARNAGEPLRCSTETCARLVPPRQQRPWERIAMP